MPIHPHDPRLQASLGIRNAAAPYPKLWVYEAVRAIYQGLAARVSEWQRVTLFAYYIREFDCAARRNHSSIECSSGDRARHQRPGGYLQQTLTQGPTKFGG